MKNRNLTLLILTFVALSVACQKKAPVTWKTISAENSCVVNSEGFVDAYNSITGLKNHWSMILSIRPVANSNMRHAIAIIEYDGRLEGYSDDWGSYWICGKQDTAMLEAQAAQGDYTTIVKYWSASFNCPVDFNSGIFRYDY